MSVEKTTTATSGNLPVSLLSTFNCDQLALIFGTCMVDAVFVLDSETLQLVAINQQMMQLLGRDFSDFEQADFSFDRFIHADERGVFHTWFTSGATDGESVFSTHLVDVNGGVHAVEITLKTIRWHRKDYCLGFVRPCGERQQRETHLHDELQLQRARAQEALQSSMRLYDINEKTKSTLVLTTKLLNVDKEKQLYKETVQILTDEDSLNFRNATFLVLQDSDLRVVCSTEERDLEVFSLREDNKYSHWIRQGCPRHEPVTETDAGILVPLRSRESLLGVVEVEQYQRERLFFEEYKEICQWQRDMLMRIGDIIALLLDNLRLQRELKRQSIIDPLTQAYNRNFFMSRLTSEVHRASRYSRPVSLVFIDVDRFKGINDQHGHLNGDQVLRELGGLFKTMLRDTDVLCRFGGDEFVMLLPETSASMAQVTVEKLMEAVRSEAFTSLDDASLKIPVTISAGIATFQKGQSDEEFLRSADAALYEAKKRGRNQAATGSR